MITCESLAEFCDGELDTPQAYEFRAHLATCNACQVGVVEHIQLCARLSKLRPEIETGPVMAPGKDGTR